MTICSYDNSGQIKFDVDIEMEQGYWNTSSSRLWTKIRDYMHDDLVKIYKDMRQNGLSFENLMKYFYDDQISVIPQTYYNKDADIKYIPYADQYIGKAHGDGYQHLKRWLKRRITFCDTLFDYTPSYTNDILTIRANTTEEMTLEIETYTPVYQHLSWYNNQMDKKKIDGKTSVTFTGTAQASTDQEILIYGGSNIKAIRGISSTNPNQVLIGSATRLTEIDLSNCPILTTVNSDKANFTPHTYLNKLDISNCPQLGGILKANNSPLLREINAKNTAVTGIQLPPSIRNLEVLRLPNSISTLTLNDAGLLNTLEFDDGINLQSIALTNCNNLTNCINFDLTKTPTVVLDNSYNAEELYMSETTNLTLKNMPTLKRVIYTPNDEYEEFDINNVINGKNYKVTTFNNPNMKEFITTADNRLSNAHRSKVTRVIDYIEGDGTAYLNTRYTPKSNTKIVLDAQIDNNKQYGHWLGCEGQNKIQWDNSGALISNNWTITPTTNLTTRQTYTITATESTYELLLFCGYYINALETNYIGKGKIYSMKIYEGDTLVHDYIPAMNGHIVTLYDNIDNTYLEVVGTLLFNYRIIYPDITPNTVFSANTLDLSDTQFTDIKFLCTTDLYNLKVPTTMKNFYCDSAMDIDTKVVTDASYEVIHDELVEQYTTDYEGNVMLREEGSITKTITDWTAGGYIHSVSGEIMASADYKYTNYFIEVVPETNFECPPVYNFMQYDKDYKPCYASDSGRKLQPNTKYVRITVANSVESITISYTGVNYRVPNIIPSSSDGSLIFSMYAPSKTVEPTVNTWDLYGLELKDFYTYGMNNDIKKYYVTKSYEFTIPNNKNYGKTITYEGDSVIVSFDCNNPSELTINPYRTLSFCTTTGQGSYFIAIKDNGIFSYRDDYIFYELLSYTFSNAPTHFEIKFDTQKVEVFANNSMLLSKRLSEMKPVNVPPHDTKLGNTMAFECYGVQTFYYKDNPFIAMPKRYEPYSIQIKNANITPNNYPTMLYPLLINTTLPITGKLDYSKYQGTSLAWAYAYTTNDVAITPLGSQQQGNITNDYNKLYGTDYVDIVDVWAYKDDDFSNKSTNEAITKAYIELTSANYTTRIDEVLQWYPNCTDLYLFDDGSVTILSNMFYNNNTNTKNQIVKVEFIDGYFLGVTNMTRTFSGCSALTTPPNTPNGVTNMNYAFYECSSLITTPNIPDGVVNMGSTFRDCSKLTIAPTIPNSVTNMGGTFRNCSKLTEVPNIPNSVTNIERTFQDCTSLTTVPNIPNSVTSMGYTFYGCSALIVAPNISDSVSYMSNTFNGCTSLTTVPNIPNGVTNMGNTFQNCSSLTTVPNIPNGVTNMQYTFYGCSALTTAPNIPDSVTDMNSTFFSCSKLTTVPNISDSVADMTNAFRNCSLLTTAPNIPNGVTNMASTFRDCTSLTECTIPLTNLTNYTNCLINCSALTNITWVGECTADFSLTTLGAPSYTEADVKELVPEHLGTVESATLTLGETYLAYLTEEEITSAVAKGWTLQ